MGKRIAPWVKVAPKAPRTAAAKKATRRRTVRDDDDEDDDDEKEPRGHCWKCGAVKYQKYLRRVPGMRSRTSTRWECANAEKCAGRKPNNRD